MCNIRLDLPAAACMPICHAAWNPWCCSVHVAGRSRLYQQLCNSCGNPFTARYFFSALRKAIFSRLCTRLVSDTASKLDARIELIRIPGACPCRRLALCHLRDPNREHVHAKNAALHYTMFTKAVCVIIVFLAPPTRLTSFEPPKRTSPRTHRLHGTVLDVQH